MEDYFISRLFGKNVARLPIEWIADDTLPESVRKRMLYNHIFFRPKELLAYIRQSVVRNTLHTDKWLEWMSTGEAAAGCKSVSFASRTVAASYGLHIDKLSGSKGTFRDCSGNLYH